MRFGRAAVFLTVCAGAIAGVAAYIYIVHGRAFSPAPSVTVNSSVVAPTVESGQSVESEVTPTPAVENKAPTPVDVEKAPAPPQPTEIYFRYTGLDAHYGKLARVRLTGNAGPEFFDTLDCEVVHVAGRRGLCLSAERGVITTYKARVFDTRSLNVLADLPLAGVPSRCRVSRDGRRAALTVFVSGHGYTAVNFSTQTLLIDLAKGTVDADLEKFTVSKDGTPIQASDFNFWGVTFAADSRYFYATLSTAGEHYLIKGDAKMHSAEVIRKGMECPSLSPDGRRIAFKQRFTDDGRVQWHIAVFDLASGRETVLAEGRSVDDQLEWLDDRRVLYSMPAGEGGSGATTDVWVARVNGGGGGPERFLGNAYSPAVLR